MRRWNAAVWAAIGLTLAGCASVTKADLAPRTDPRLRLTPAGAAPWRVDPGDPVLARLLQQADQGALDVKIALARSTKADADLAAARAARRVSVSAGADAAIGGRTFSDTARAATPGIDIRYEVDLWGRLRSAQDAAGADAAASVADVQTARLAVAAETVRAYDALRAAQAERFNAARRRDLAEQIVKLEGQRTAEGVGEDGAAAKARAALSSANARVVWLDEEADLQLARLRDLVGNPDLVLPPGALPAPARAPERVSSDVVDARPDVQAAWNRLAAADSRRAEAVADARPKFIISALLGAPDATLATLLDTRALAWALAGSITHELLDGGAKRARIDAASAEADMADLAYRKAVAAAWAQVRDALNEQARAGRDAAAVEAELADARAALEVGRRRAVEGVIDGVALAALQDNSESSAQRVLAVDVRCLDARIQLALATGGQ